MAVLAPPGARARSVGLNKLYGLPAPQAKKPPAESDWERALRIRSQALNKSLGLPNTATDTGAAKTIGPTDPPTPGKIAVSGFDPDYAALIAADPTLLSGEADLSAYGSQVDQGRKDAIRRAVIAMGFNPGANNDAVDQATIDAALANQSSTARTIQDEATHRGTDLESILAGRGLLDSGGLTGGKQRIQQNYEKANTQAVQTLLDQISGYESAAAGKKNSIAMQHAALREAAALRVQADPRYQPVGQTDAVLDPSSGLYMTPDGRWYNPDGSAASAPGGGTTAPPPPVTPPPGPPKNGGLLARNEYYLDPLSMY